MALLNADERYDFTWCGEPASISFKEGQAHFGEGRSFSFSPLKRVLPFERRHHDLDAVMITVASACNLGCSYCSVDEGNFQGNWSLSDEFRHDVVDFVGSLFSSGRRPAVSFMGGEPLIKRDHLRKLLDALSEKFDGNIQFSMPTNLTLLDEDAVGFLKAHRVHLLASIDGPEAIHNRNRPFKGSRGSFQSVHRGARMLLDAGYPWVTARPTITRVEEMYDVFVYLEALGFRSILFGMDFMDVTKRYDRSEVQKQLKKIVDHLARPADASAKARFVVIEPLTAEILNFGVTDHWEFIHCGAGVSMINVSVDGRLFPCHNYALKGVSVDRSIGTIASGIDETSLTDFVDASERVRRACSSCAVSSMCPGGCMFLNETVTNYWTGGECGLHHLPFLELLEAAFYSVATHCQGNEVEFFKVFAPKIYDTVKKLTEQAIWRETNRTKDEIHGRGARA